MKRNNKASLCHVSLAITYSFIISFVPMLSFGQTSVVNNSAGGISDFLGWDAGNPFPLIINHQAAFPINFIHDDVTTMTIGGSGGLGIFTAASGQSAVSVFSNTSCGVLITIGGAQIDLENGYTLLEGARFQSLASETLDIGLVSWSNADSPSTTFENHGTYARPSSAPLSIGLYAEVNSPSLPNTSTLSAYFNGDVTITGTLDGPSDLTLKNSIEELTIEHASILSELNPKSYYFIQDHPRLQLSSQKQYGFLAQEVEAHFPNLTQRVNVPGEYAETEEEMLDTCSHLTVDYIKFIALSVNKFKIQDEQIVMNNQKLTELEARMLFLIEQKINLQKSKSDQTEVGANNFEFKLYPNPNNGLLNIRIESTDLNNSTIEIFDLNGRKLLHENLPIYKKGTTLNIDVSHLDSGIYDLRISNSDQFSSSKFVKK